MGKIPAIANILFGLVPLFVASSMALFAALNNLLPGVGLALAIATMLAGFVAFALAKFTRFQSGIWFSFGTRGMPAWARRSYIGGLVAVAFGAIGSMTVLLWR